MNDPSIPADKVQAVADWLWDEMMANGGFDEKIAPQLAARAEMAGEVRRLLLALLSAPKRPLPTPKRRRPTPKRPTMEDTPPEERESCQWMQADVQGQGRAAIIIPVLGDGRSVLIDMRGDVIYKDYERVTPRPDLPRMEWKVPDW